MSTSHRFNHRIFASTITAAALILAACGGSSDSSGSDRQRNSSFLQADCFQTQKDKDDAIAAANRDYDEAAQAESELPDLNAAYMDAQDRYMRAQGNLNIPNLNEASFIKPTPSSSIPVSSVPRSSVPTPTIPVSSVPVSSIPTPTIPVTSVPTGGGINIDEITQAKNAMDVAFEKYQQAKQKAQWKNSFAAHKEDVNNHPLCSDTIAPVTENSESPDPTDGGGVGPAGTDSTFVDNPDTTVVADGPDTTSILGSTSSSVTDSSVVDSTVPDTSSSIPEPIGDPVPPAPELTCDAPVLDDGSTYVVNVDGTFSVSHDLCIDARAKAAVNGLDDAEVSMSIVGNKVIWDITPHKSGTFVYKFLFIDSSTDRRVSDYTEATIDVTAKDDPCNGKIPDFSEDTEGSLVVSSAATCDAAEGVQSLLFNGADKPFYVETYGRSYSARDLAGIDAFGPITRIIVWHYIGNGHVGEPFIWDRPETTSSSVSPDTTAPTDTTGGSDTSAPSVTDAPRTTDGPVTTDTMGGGSGSSTTTPTTVPEDQTVVRALPPVILVQEPKPDANVVIAAIPNNVVGLTCDTACVTAAAVQAGITAEDVSTVEISYNGGAFVVLDGGFMAPNSPTGTTLRLRVTPKSGEPKILSTRLVSGSIDLVAEGLATTNSSVTSLGDAATSASSSSFPWWMVIVAILLVLLLVIFLVRRKKDDDEGSAAPTAATV